MINLYNVVKRGETLKDIEIAMETLNMFVLDLENKNKPKLYENITDIYDEIQRAIQGNTDCDFFHSFFLTTIQEIEDYFDNRENKLRKEITIMQEARFDILAQLRVLHK